MARKLAARLGPRPPSYQPDSPVDLTLSVSDLIDPHSGGWDIRRIRQVIAAEDVELILKTKIDPAKKDSLRWGFSNNGVYNSKSAYKVLQNLQELRSPASSRLPPIEKQLWNKLWKVKAPPPRSSNTSYGTPSQVYLQSSNSSALEEFASIQYISFVWPCC